VPAALAGVTSGDGMPSVTSLVSSTHPSATTWYARSSPAFSWRAASLPWDVGGYSWTLDRNPTTTPDTTAEIRGLDFAPPLDLATGGNAWGVANGDFNRDGKFDLATANKSADSISILLGDGSGGFATKSDFATGVAPTAIVAGDFNRDGKLDVATANDTGNSISILVGDGSGGFATKSDSATGAAPSAIAVGDLNGDGKLDLVTANATGDSVSVLLGNGTGGFAAHADVAVGAHPRSVAIGDLNGDRKADLATANLGADSVSILLGNGGGGFAAKTDYATGVAPSAIVVGDFNGDRKADLATADSGADSVSVLIGVGDGSFPTHHGYDITYNVDANPQALVVGDFNGDGNQDLATANSAENDVSVLLGQGDGYFDWWWGCTVSILHAPRSITVGDFDRDGRSDLATGDSGGFVSELLNATPDPAAAFTKRADGVWYFHVSAVLGLGQGATSTMKVQIDTARPITRALIAARVKHGARAKLKYRVTDARPGSPTAAVTIKIKNVAGKIVKTLKLGSKTVNTSQTASFGCALPKGTYRWTITAVDAAGNPQSKAGSSKLVVY
jgi:hypothetical protein